MNKLFAGLLYIYSFSIVACPNALPTDHVNFCSSFKSAAVCYCTASGLPSALCQDMKSLYNRMVIVLGSLEKVCAYQHNSTTQECIDDWNCYLRGGVNSHGAACSSTRLACE